jgi:hypothetical protein
MRRSWLVVFALLVLACGREDSGRLSESCGQILDATCVKLIECRAIGGDGKVVSRVTCALVRSQGLEACTSNPGKLPAATDHEIDTCVTDIMEQTGCTDICGKVPQGPLSCQKLRTMPNTDFVTCEQ